MSRLRIIKDLSSDTKAGYTVMSVICALLLMCCLACFIRVVALPLPFVFPALFAVTTFVELCLLVFCLFEIYMIKKQSAFYLEIEAPREGEELPSSVIFMGRLDGGNLYVRVASKIEDPLV